MKYIVFNLLLFSGAFFASKELFPPRKITNIKIKTVSCTDIQKTIVTTEEIPGPCNPQTVKKFEEDAKSFPKIVMDKVTELHEEIKKEIKKVPETEEKLQIETKRKLELEAISNEFQKKYPRFQLKTSLPDDYLNYGIHTGDYKDVKTFLGERECKIPAFNIATAETSYLGLFFTLNIARNFGGIIRIINEKFVSLIEGSMSFENIDEYFEKKLLLDASFQSWNRDGRPKHAQTFYYQNHRIIHSKRSFEKNLFSSPWLYNSCNKSISTVSNFCSLDAGMDMEYKEFFYLTQFDLLLGNIYCKKSSETGWTRIATMEFIQI